MYKLITTICVCGILISAAGAPGAVQIYENFATNPGWLEQDNRINGLDFGFSYTNNTGQGAGEAGGVFSNTGNGYYGADITDAEGVGLLAAMETLHAEGYGICTGVSEGGSVSPHIGWWDRDQSLTGTPAHFLGVDIQYRSNTDQYNGYLGFTNSSGNASWVVFEDAFTVGVPFTWSIDWDPGTGLLSGTIDSNSGSQTITDPNALNAEFDIFGLYNGSFGHSDGATTAFIDSVEFTSAVPAPPPFPGDANRDDYVNETDAALLAENWLTGPEATWEQGDFNKDGWINDVDATILAVNFGHTPGSAVPEPSTILLLATAMAALWMAGLNSRRGKESVTA